MTQEKRLPEHADASTSPELFGTDGLQLKAGTPPPRIAPLKATPVYDTYWHFAAERQAVFFRRLHGQLPPWTADHILREYRFTNVYRIADRVSQYLLSNVIVRGDLPSEPQELCFRILLFKIFNRIDTWELLERSVGPLVFADYSFDRYDGVLSQALALGQPIYSPAYIMPTTGTRSRARKHQGHLYMIEHMIEDQLPARLSCATTMQQAFDLLSAYSGIGDFLAYQYVTDINYSDLTNFTEMEFVMPGPGAVSGIRKCFLDTAGLNDAEVIRFMVDRQELEFERLGLDFQTLWGRRLQLIDCQNIFCEVDKYARVRHPEYSTFSGRTRIKQRFHLNPRPLSFGYPPKWQIASPITNRAELSTPPDQDHSRRPSMDLKTYQRLAAETDKNPSRDERAITIPILGLAGEAGELVSEYKKFLRDGEAHTLFRDRFAEELGDLLWYVANVASKFDLDLEDIAAQNLIKCRQRWGALPTRAALDEAFPIEERFPRKFLIDFSTFHDENETPRIRALYKGQPFGASLTDNSYVADHYGFHDVLHLSFVAVLGWSPVARKLLGLKRKSRANIDLVEDGGRAIAIEEGLSTMIFAYAKGYNWLDGNVSVSVELLRTIRSMTAHLEISRCTSGEWEAAIVQGFAAWRAMRLRGAGTLIVDLDKQVVVIKEP